jgi:UDP:flavonoid glycosyltransferase YjiC (YdhE family)
VAWAKVGINLRTSRPSSRAVAKAVRRVLAEPRYREAAGRIGAEIAASPGVAGLESLIAQAARAKLPPSLG